MLLAKKLPMHLWAEATATAVYILNRTGQSRMGGNHTPYELWTEKKPDLGHMRVFGSDAYVHVPKLKTTKLDPRAKKLILIGYDSESSNYRLYDPDTKSVSVSRHVVFNKQNGAKPNVPTPKVEPTLPMSQESDEEEAENRSKSGAVVENAGADDAVAAASACSRGRTQRRGERGRRCKERSTIRGVNASNAT